MVAEDKWRRFFDEVKLTHTTPCNESPQSIPGILFISSPFTSVSEAFILVGLGGVDLLLTTAWPSGLDQKLEDSSNRNRCTHIASSGVHCMAFFPDQSVLFAGASKAWQSGRTPPMAGSEYAFMKT